MESMLLNTNLPHSGLEMWGGIECTINRIGNTFRDQLEYSGHYARPCDIRALADLGITHLRYPVLWEKHQQHESKPIDWRWAEKRLSLIATSGMVPVVGLLHHGSGPAFTNLLDPKFPEKFARYAARLARTFPWLSNFIPINEPLTTARFSCLYGHWFPHKRNDVDFCRALINQMKATVLAMKEIRKVNPAAVFIQTEDLAKVHSTEVLKYQADFENQRRWLSYDLLCGMINQYHPLWDYFIQSEIPAEELTFFLQNACPPTMLGLNYYVTSERFLSHNIDGVPLENIGGNGQHRYIDTEAHRAGCAEGMAALAVECWDRYRLPIVMTEVHLGCTCDEQIRWLMEMWHQARALKRIGVDVRALTAWSLLGAYDWDTLLTQCNMRYECGGFDLHEGNLHLNALGNVVRSLALNGNYSDPLLDTPGWWAQIGTEVPREEIIA